MKFIAIAAVAAGAAVLAMSVPEIRRYLKVRSM
jgi:hypothetical protein